MKKSLLCLMIILALSITAFSGYAQDDKTSLLLESIGVLSGNSMYLTYVSIGSLADGYATKTYKKDVAEKLMMEYIQLSMITKKQFEKLQASGILSAEDLDFIKKIIKTYGLLIEEAQGYKEYISTGNVKHLKTFDVKRNEAWAMIKEILNLK